MRYKISKYFLTSTKRKIKYYFLNNNSQITIVFFHGFMSDMNGAKPKAIQSFCNKQKINYLKFEYSGHGKSSGKFTDGNISKWTNDAKQLIKKKTKGKLLFVGSSMGSWIALNLLLYFKKKIKGFIGISSAPEFLEKLMWKKFSKKIKKIIMSKKIYHLEHDGYTYPLSKQLILDGRKNKVLNNKINLKIPVILFHGTKDDVVPVSYSKKILKIFVNSKKKLVIVKNGDHSLSSPKWLKILKKELKIIIN